MRSGARVAGSIPVCANFPLIWAPSFGRPRPMLALPAGLRQRMPVATGFSVKKPLAADTNRGRGHQAHKHARRMVARATGRSSPLACAPRAPSRHRRKDPPDASVARRGALPCPERPRGAEQLRHVTPHAACGGTARRRIPARVSPCMDQYRNSP